MNSLSWLLYLAQVGGNIGGFFFALALVCGIGGIVALIGYFGNKDSFSTFGYDKNEVKRKALLDEIDSWRRWAIFGVSGVMFFGTVSALMPSHRTMMLIASSEMGERLLNNDKVTSIIDPSVELLRTYIQKELEKTKAELEKPNK